MHVLYVLAVIKFIWIEYILSISCSSHSMGLLLDATHEETCFTDCHRYFNFCSNALLLQLDVLFGNLPEMVEFQVEFLKTLEDGTRLVPDLEKLERVDQFKVPSPCL